MPRNNSGRRKETRKEGAKAREKQMLVRECGHWHTDNGFKYCNYMDNK